jgi:F-type H+-transporting ATPase subunit a
MVVVVSIVCLFLQWSTRKKKLVPSASQALCEMLFKFIENLVSEQMGKNSFKYIPFIFSLFMFILGSNLLGLCPYAFTVTSHIAVTFALASSVSLCMLGSGIAKHRWKFVWFFCPRDLPGYIRPLMIPVEMITFVTKPISLSIRLFANMLAGHIMVKLVAGTCVAFVTRFFGLFSLLPMGLNVLILGFEFLVSILQAYVFTLLTCIYLNSVSHLE